MPPRSKKSASSKKRAAKKSASFSKKRSKRASSFSKKSSKRAVSKKRSKKSVSKKSSKRAVSKKSSKKRSKRAVSKKSSKRASSSSKKSSKKSSKRTASKKSAASKKSSKRATSKRAAPKSAKKSVKATARARKMLPIELQPPEDEASRVIFDFCNGGLKAIKDTVFPADSRANLFQQMLKNKKQHTALVKEASVLANYLKLCMNNKKNKNELKKLYSGIKDVSGDGWCFYHSILTALENTSNKQKAIALSHEVVQWLRNNRASVLTNNIMVNHIRTIEEKYNSELYNSIIPIYDDKYGPARTLTFNEYLYLSEKETDEQLPVVWPEVAVVGYAIANLKNIELQIYSNKTASLLATFLPFHTVPTKTVSLWYLGATQNHFGLLVPRGSQG